MSSCDETGLNEQCTTIRVQSGYNGYHSAPEDVIGFYLGLPTFNLSYTGVVLLDFSQPMKAYRLTRRFGSSEYY